MTAAEKIILSVVILLWLTSFSFLIAGLIRIKTHSVLAGIKPAITSAVFLVAAQIFMVILRFISR